MTVILKQRLHSPCDPWRDMVIIQGEWFMFFPAAVIMAGKFERTDRPKPIH